MDSLMLTDTKEMAAYFESVCKETNLFKLVSNWLMGPVKSYLNENNLEINQFALQPEKLAALIEMVQEGKVSYSAAAQEIFPKMILEVDSDPSDLAIQLNLLQNSNENELQSFIDQVLSQMPEKVTEYRSGKKGLIGLFIGEVKKASKGQADPKLTNELLLKALG